MNGAELSNADLYQIIAIAVCIVLSAFFSASETAITSLGALRVRHLIDSKGKSMRHLQIWISKPHHILTTILVYNNAINILATSIATSLAITYFDSNAIGIATGTITFLVLVFGEIIPKSFAKANSEKFATLSMHIVRASYFAIFPLVWIMSESTKVIISYLSDEKEKPSITEEEIEFLINVGESDGAIENTKRDMISGVFDFDETVVREIMTPRIDLHALNCETATVAEAIEIINETGHSRIPVYKESVDNITGIILAKDLLRSSLNAGSATKLKEIIREPYFTPESKPIMEVFKDLKKSKVHLAVVVDEYGGTAGIVTMEDILEEIVGEIHDEHDVEETKISEMNDGVFEVAGSVNIDEFVEFFSLQDTVTEEEQVKLDADVDTIGGWVTEIVGELPEVGQKVTVGHLNIEVTEVGQRRIEKMRVEREEPMEQEPEES